MKGLFDMATTPNIRFLLILVIGFAFATKAVFFSDPVKAAYLPMTPAPLAAFMDIPADASFSQITGVTFDIPEDMRLPESSLTASKDSFQAQVAPMVLNWDNV